jgi:CheY-like chemotaxis protein
MQRPHHPRGRANVQARHKRLKILLVDDSQADVYLFQEAFRAVQGVHELEVARDGEQALQVLHAAGGKEHLHALILLDLNLPKTDGFEVLRAIRADSKLCAIPVIVVSSSLDEGQVRQAYELGANAYIVKPLDDFVDLVGDFERFWLRRAELP